MRRLFFRQYVFFVRVRPLHFLLFTVLFGCDRVVQCKVRSVFDLLFRVHSLPLSDFNGGYRYCDMSIITYLEIDWCFV